MWIQLGLFNPHYQNVQAENGDNLVTTGTKTFNFMQLKNDADYPIEYTAVLYRMKEETTLPVTPELSGSSFADIPSCLLSSDVNESQVVRAVTVQ